MKKKIIKILKSRLIMFSMATAMTFGYIAPTIVYAEPSSTTKTEAKNNGTYDTSNVETITFFGDDCGVGLEVASGNDSTKSWYCERGKGLTWLKSQIDSYKGITHSKKTAVVIAAGFNECLNTLKAKDYADYINQKADEFNGKGTVPFYYVNVTPVDEHKYGTALNSKIEAWNEYMRNNLNKKVVYIDAYSLVNKNLQTKNDGYHLTEDEYRVIYEQVVHTIGLKTAEEIAQDKIKEANASKEVKAINGWGIDKQGEPVYYDGDQKIVTGWYEIEGGKYYFDQYGHCLKELQEIDGKTYFFNSIGLMSRGLVKIDNGKYSIFGEDGARLDKWQEYGGEKYYINKDGVCLSGWWTIGTRTYYFEEDGAVATGLTRVDGKTYYFDEDGGVRVGWQTIDGKKYYFEDGGVMAIGKYELDGKHYYFFEEGGMATGWNTENDGVRYYSSNGTMVTGFQKIDGEGYFFEEGGLMKTGWYEFKDGKRFFDSTGKMAKGIRKVSGETYYFDKETGYMQTGWIKIDGEKTYFGKNGKIGTGWQKIDGKKYYLDKGGHITTDIANISGKIYFFNKSGAVIFVLPIWIIVILILAGFAGYGFYTTKKDPELKEKIMNKIREISSSVDSQKENENPTKRADTSDMYGDDDDEVIEDE